MKAVMRGQVLPEDLIIQELCLFQRKKTAMYRWDLEVLHGTGTE